MEPLHIICAAYLFCCVVFSLTIIFQPSESYSNRFWKLLAIGFMLMGFLLLCAPKAYSGLQQIQQEQLKQGERERVCLEVTRRSLGRIKCSFAGDLGVLEFRDGEILRATNWTGNRKRLLDTMCQAADQVQEVFPKGTTNLYTCLKQ